MTGRDDPFARLAGALALAESGASTDYDLNPGVTLPPDRVLRMAGVLVPVLETAAGPQVILTMRSSALKHHPGQIAFPGGKVDEHDAGPVAAALREAREEIGLASDNVEVMGELPPHETGTGFRMVPVLARLKAEFRAIPEQGEVAEVFRVPLSHVADLSRYRIEARRWRGYRRNYWVVPYGPYYIWGATAMILRRLALRLDQCG
jgi:8-oxo-dGTP pyrophosphatase MutT (NUDIX family)